LLSERGGGHGVAAAGNVDVHYPVSGAQARAAFSVFFFIAACRGVIARRFCGAFLFLRALVVVLLPLFLPGLVAVADFQRLLSAPLVVQVVLRACSMQCSGCRICRRISRGRISTCCRFHQ